MGTKMETNKDNKINYIEQPDPNFQNFEFIKELTSDSKGSLNMSLDNSFAVFNSYDDILYLVYSNGMFSIVLYNLIDYKRINTVKNAHQSNINCFRYCQDKKNKRDIIMSSSELDNNIKLWNVKNLECLVDIKKINDVPYLYTACFLTDNNKIYIISSHCLTGGLSSPIKVFDINGKKIKEINKSREKTYFIDSYHDNYLNTNFLLTGNNGYSISYDFDKNEIYHKYNDNDFQNHISVIIKNNEKTVKLIESSLDGNIRIWNFYNAILLQKIKVNNDWIFTICLWEDKYLFITCYEGILKILNLENEIFIKKKNLRIHKYKSLTSIKKIFHPEYGECLISQGSETNQIKLWGNKSPLK